MLDGGVCWGLRRRRRRHKEVPGILESATATEAIAGAAAASGEDAAARAVRDAAAQLEAPALVLIFPTGINAEMAAMQAASAAGGARIAGITGSGAIASDGA